MKHNEDSRVKIPTILHLMRLGYEYLSLKDHEWDIETNIFSSIFIASLMRINKNLQEDDAVRVLSEVKLLLDYDDLGKAFYERLINQSNIKLIDLENFERNTFSVVTELPCKNGDEEFRPDITLLINGLPLAFIEVKKPHNQDGILAERNRINTRSQNPKFKRFINATQIMIFSNNMEYDDTDLEPIQGAFYATSSNNYVSFNYFREEETFDLTKLLNSISDHQEKEVLSDNNLLVIRNNPEFLLNKEPNRPTNRICTSLLSKQRLQFLLKYSLTYVNEFGEMQKHIMRYPQIFATKAISDALDKGVKQGIIWHTQGSGKTALAFYNVRYLTDYFQKQRIVPKFYFIVDRLDLLQQAQREFLARGLVVHAISSRDDFVKDIKATKAIHNDFGKAEITVVNIQKFKDDPDVIATNDYDVSVQRVYFLDEVHRSYNPKGSFLANLTQSDPNAIRIGLTGTPLLGDDYNSRILFGDYIHKYYYNASIADGYTLRLIREEIESNFRLKLKEALANLEIEMGSIKQQQITSHPQFIHPMLTYILDDFERSRGAFNDNSIGAMVICDSADQAKNMYDLFVQKQNLATDQVNHQTVKTAALILHDIGTKQERKDWVEAFKEGKIDILFVYNMLLTGFDAKRLKKLYLGRIVRKHNLLQALTRVNRRYKNFKYGYVVDFADIRKEFDETNRAYFDELQSELGDELEHYSHLFKSSDEIDIEINNIKDLLFEFDIDNVEVFSDQIGLIDDREKLLNLKKALADAKSLYNLIRLQKKYDFLNQLDFQRINILYREVSNHLDLLNLKYSLDEGEDTSHLLNLALEDVIFKFRKIGEEELVLADELKSTLRKTREALANNFDQQDPKFISLKEELERLFKKKKLSEVAQEEMIENIHILNSIHERIRSLNNENDRIKHKYNGDAKYARIHKRLVERTTELSANERKIHEALIEVKKQADEKVFNNEQLVENNAYFERQIQPVVITCFMQEQGIRLTAPVAEGINRLVVQEYLSEFNNGLYS